jgi:hypothetical protein
MGGIEAVRQAHGGGRDALAVVNRGERTRDGGRRRTMERIFCRTLRQRAIGKAGGNLPEQRMPIFGRNVMEGKQRISGALDAGRLGGAHGEALGSELASDRIETLGAGALGLARAPHESRGKAMFLGPQQRGGGKPRACEQPGPDEAIAEIAVPAMIEHRLCATQCDLGGIDDGVDQLTRTRTHLVVDAESWRPRQFDPSRRNPIAEQRLRSVSGG